MPDIQAVPSVAEANRALRTAALDAAVTMRMAIRRLGPDADAIAIQLLDAHAGALQDAVKASNDALDAQAFGPLDGLKVGG